MIEFRNVTVCYEPHRRYPVNALENVNLKISAGDWVFLVGPSGAGKSSLLKLIYAGIRATSGEVLVEGRDVVKLKRGEIPQLRRRIGIIFQNFQLLEQKTAWENVAFALQVIGTPQAQLVREVPRALETVGLPHKAHALPHELSGGEQQRVAIARAIVNDPPILLADEPTGNLDPKTGWEIAEVLKRINEERGTTVVMGTHDRFLVNALKKRVVRLVDGHIASDEASGIYHSDDDDLWNRQITSEGASTPAGAPASAPVVEPMPVAAVEARVASPEARSISIRSTPAAAPIAATSIAATSIAATPVAAKASNGAHHVEHHVEERDAENGISKEPVALETNDEDVDRGHLQAALRNNAPLGSEDNPIIRY